MGATGPQGATGPAGLTFQGAWSNATSYAVNDAVSFGGSSYLATVASQGAEPDLSPSYWSLLARQGSATNVFPAYSSLVIRPLTISDSDTYLYYVLTNGSVPVTLPHCKNGSTTYDGKRLSLIVMATGNHGPTLETVGSDQIYVISSATTSTSYTVSWPAMSLVCSNAPGTPTWFLNPGQF